MNDDSYFRIVSWHVVREITEMGSVRALCGQSRVATVNLGLPSGRTCETCLKIAKRRDDPS